MTQQQTLTAKRLRQLLSYDSESGVFTRIAKTNRRHLIGEKCGYKTRSGYIAIGVDGVNHLAHRLAYLFMTGVHPVNQIDHRDLNKSNNAWRNLREATSQQQCWNAPRRPKNLSGYKGVSQDKRRGTFSAYICRNGKSWFLGSRKTAEEAFSLYRAAVTAERGDFARVS